MSNDYETDPHTLARATDPETSHQAAHAVDSAGWEEKVYCALLSMGLGGGTIKEVTHRYFGMQHILTTSPRFAPLRRKGLIFDTGQRRERRIVWMVSSLKDEWLRIATPDDLVKMEKANTPKTKEVVCPRCWARLLVSSTGAVQLKAANDG